MPSPWNKKTTRTAAVAAHHHHHHQSLDSWQGLMVQRADAVDLIMPPRLSKKQLSLSANRESLFDLLEEEEPQADPRPVRQLLHKMQKIISSPSSPLTPSPPDMTKKYGRQGEQSDLSAISSRRTLQESTSDMSIDDATTIVTDESVEVEAPEEENVELPTSSAKAPSVVFLPNKQKIRKSFLRKSFRRCIGQSKVSNDSKTSSKTNSSNNSSSNKKEEIRLPDPGIFSNNHILVNRERVVRGLSKLNRSRFLDSMAHSHAVDLAQDENLVHSVDLLADLQRQLGSNEVGENVQRGPNIRQMHESAMNRGSTSRGNILRGAYVEFGMATALGKDGKLYMVQLFRGLPKDKKEEHQLVRD